MISKGAPDFQRRIAGGMSFMANDVATVASAGNSIAIMPAVGRYGAEAAVLTPPFERASSRLRIRKAIRNEQ
ncbi:hypothetical protein MesoLj131b_44960 [Mesorhizobium sp. 131-2-5]|nr:hypothetical protein MesoLj131b_44960 [Mesorhizobium sp. 131-2-5]